METMVGSGSGTGLDWANGKTVSGMTTTRCRQRNARVGTMGRCVAAGVAEFGPSTIGACCDFERMARCWRQFLIRHSGFQFVSKRNRLAIFGHALGAIVWCALRGMGPF